MKFPSLFKKVNNKKDTYSYKELKLKAAGVSYAVVTASDKIVERILTYVSALNNLDENGKTKIHFIVMYVTLFNAQKLFRTYIEKESYYTAFITLLYLIFKKMTGIDGKLLINDIEEQITKYGKSEEISYIGKKVCYELGIKDAITAYEISNVYLLSLKHGGFESLKIAWNLPERDLASILEPIDLSK